MATILQPLDPAPAVQIGDINIIALDAGKSDKGTVATIQASNGEVYAHRLVQLAKPSDREAFAKEVAKSASIPEEQVKTALLGLTNDVEVMLRNRNTGKVKKADAAPQVATYNQTPDGLIYLKPTMNGNVPVLLTNFVAKIISDVAHDDGAEVRHVFEIEASFKNRTHRFQISSSQFMNMNWATEHLGASAIIYPGSTLRDHARTAVQALSGDIPHRHVYCHTGWRKLDCGWVYLHAGGAIGPDGPLTSIEVSL